MTDRATVGDRIWLWGHVAGSWNGSFGLPGISRIEPQDAAKLLGIRNLIMVRYDGKPVPPYEEAARPLAGMERLVWSVVGASGATDPGDIDAVLAFARSAPNVTGVVMDDFFNFSRTDGSVAALTPAQVRDLRARLETPRGRLDLWEVWYTHQHDPRVREHLELCDIASHWTWRAADLADLERNFERFEKLAPSPRKALGCYLYDFGEQRQMTIPAMERQCTVALRLLREKRIDEIVFCGGCLCDLGFETVEWTRRWIAGHGGEPAV